MKTPTAKKFRDNDFENLRNQLARALADYDNLRKRVEKEKENYRLVAGLTLITKLLPVYDMLREAQKHLNDSGLAITINEFETVLREEGVEKINVDPGTRFDENLHEALEITEGKKGMIVEEVLSGWKYIKGPVIRVAKVKVGDK